MADCYWTPHYSLLPFSMKTEPQFRLSCVSSLNQWIGIGLSQSQQFYFQISQPP